MAFPVSEVESLEASHLSPPLCPAPASVLVLLSHGLMKNSSTPTSAHMPRKHTCLTPGGPAFEGSEFFRLLKKAASGCMCGCGTGPAAHGCLESHRWVYLCPVHIVTS